jgi:ammonium transporter, Amt family
MTPSRLWSPHGWLSWETEKPLLGIGTVDFAGTKVVHMVGGVTALMGAIFIGPRKGRYLPDGTPNPEWSAGHSAMLVCAGTMVLWTGWCAACALRHARQRKPQAPATVAARHLSWMQRPAFPHRHPERLECRVVPICGASGTASTALAVGGKEVLVVRTAVVTTMGACGGALTALALSTWRRSYSFGDLCNGVLCGLVAITAGACVIDPWAGIVAGALGASIFFFAEHSIARLGVDDAVGASSMHGCVGFWGTLVPGIFARDDFMHELMGHAGAMHSKGLMNGIFLGGDGKLLGCQVIGAPSYPPLRCSQLAVATLLPRLHCCHARQRGHLCLCT